MSAPEGSAKVRPITARQREVLRLTAAGHSPTEVGRALGISSQAVHGHFRRVRVNGHAVPCRRQRSADLAAPSLSRVTADGALAAVSASIIEHERLVATRLDEVAAQIDELQRERTSLQDGMAALREMRA
jgi:DNA-binding CsgD family transcriptional regulator